MHFRQHHYVRPGVLELIVKSASRTEAALVALESGRREEAHDLWESVDDSALLQAGDSWDEQTHLLGPRWKLERPDPIGPPGSFVTASIARRVYERDDYRRRNCEMPVFTSWRGSRIGDLITAFPELTPERLVTEEAEQLVVSQIAVVYPIWSSESKALWAKRFLRS